MNNTKEFGINCLKSVLTGRSVLLSVILFLSLEFDREEKFSLIISKVSVNYCILFELHIFHKMYGIFFLSRSKD